MPFSKSRTARNHRHADVGEDRLPHAGYTEGAEQQADCLDAEGKADILPDDSLRSPGNLHDAHDGGRLI